MTELSGMLDGLGLSAIVRFLSGLHKSGRLELTQHDWVGEIHFDSGRLTHASLGTRTGLIALDALVEVLPGASFTFDSHAQPTDEPTIQLGNDDLLAHVDEVAARVARGQRRLPEANAVPAQATIESGAEEPLQLDRAALQTLLLVDGQRSVREIVAQRGSLDALWHLARLGEAGLIQLDRPPLTREAATVGDDTLQTVVPERPAPQVVEPFAAITMAQPIAPVSPPEVSPEAPTEVPLVHAAHCPKLGFEDDPGSSFGRPTRLHRCFAAGQPLPLSLDQQRELCLGDHFETCPRLAAAAPRAPRPTPLQPEPTLTEVPRIVRLPLTGRSVSMERDGPTSAALEPRPLRPINSPLRDPDGSRPPTLTPPTPLRARLNRFANGTAAATPAASVASEKVTAPPLEPPPAAPPAAKPPREPQRPSVADETRNAAEIPIYERRVGPLPVLAIPVIGVVLVAAVALVIMLLPELGSLFSDNTLDPASLPNASLVEAGTPVADLGLSRPTPVPVRATAVEVQGVQATAQPSPLAAQSTGDSGAAAQPTPAAVQANAPLFDERFAANDAGWPSNPVGAALITNGTYRIATRQAGQFAAVGAPVANVPADVVVSATFRKLAGPAGGGYGIIVRDQEQTVRDGSSQDGHYYVLEIGDKGEVGIWRRDADHWVDLLPWQHAEAVNTGNGTNEMTVGAVGSTLSLAVNGTQVATRTDGTFSNGRAGLFVGGDGNQVAVSRFAIQTP
jgi:hypothetical protein